MADEGVEQCGQGELERYEVTGTRTSSGVSRTSVISRPSGKGNNGDAGIDLLEKRFLCWLEQIFGEIPQNITFASPKSWKGPFYPGRMPSTSHNGQRSKESESSKVGQIRRISKFTCRHSLFGNEHNSSLSVRFPVEASTETAQAGRPPLSARHIGQGACEIDEKISRTI